MQYRGVGTWAPKLPEISLMAVTLAGLGGGPRLIVDRGGLLLAAVLLWLTDVAETS